MNLARGPSRRAALAVATGAVCLMAVTAGFQAIWGWDIGFYLAMGRWMAEHRTFPAVESLTYPLAGRPIVDLYWLYELAAWGLYTGAGTVGLIVANITVTLAAVAVGLRRVWERRRGGVFTGILLHIPFILGNTWELRPHTVSWLFLSMLLWVLERRTRREPAPLWAIPALMALWTNTHALFALGLVVLGAYALTECCKGRAVDRPLLAAALAGAAACLLNPYGIRGLEVPLVQLANLQADSVFKSAVGILEYRSLWDFGAYGSGSHAPGYQPLPYLHAWVLLGASSAPFWWRGAARGERLTFALTLAAFLLARKNFGYHFVAALPLVAEGCAAVAQRFVRGCARGRGRRIAHGARWAGALAALALGVTMVLHARSGYLYHGRHGAARPGPGFNPHTLPVRAAAFLNRADVPPGRLLNALHDGGYLEFATRRPVFIDGRLEVGGAAWYRQHLATTRPDQLGATILRHDIQFVVVPFSDIPAWFQAIAAQEAWRCVHLDDYSAIFFRGDFAPWIPALAAPASGGAPPWGGPDAERRVLARAAALRNPGGLATLRGPHYYPLAEIRLCRAYQQMGWSEAAVAVGLRGLARTTFEAPDLLLNLGSAYWMVGRHGPAALCYRAWFASRRGDRLDPALAATVRARLQLAEGTAPPPR